MFIESATSKKFFLAPAERNMGWLPHTNEGNIAPAGARVIELEAVSINISLPGAKTNSVVALES